MPDPDSMTVGQRLHEVRAWRGMTLREVAELADFSAPYLWRIEKGERSIERRSTLESLARALRVAPSELTDMPRVGAGTDRDLSEAVAAMGRVEAALTDVHVGETAVSRPQWAAVRSELADFDRLRIAADYHGIMVASAALIPRLNALVHDPAAPRKKVLAALVQVYMGSGLITRYLGAQGLPSIAAMHAKQAAELLDDPVITALASWTRAHTLGSGARARMRQVAIDTADDLAPHLARRDARELHGMLMLAAALAAGADKDADPVRDHLDEAEQMARSMPETGGSGFAHLSFGRMNVEIWRVTLAVELGEHDLAVRLRERIAPDILVSRDRRSSYWADLGRALATTKAGREDAVAAFLNAEREAPVRTRANAYVRGSVTALLPKVRRDSDAGRELRGLAYRLGVR